VSSAAARPAALRAPLPPLPPAEAAAALAPGAVLHGCVALVDVIALIVAEDDSAEGAGTVQGDDYALEGDEALDALECLLHGMQVATGDDIE
jgi:hypothetical protein